MEEQEQTTPHAPDFEGEKMKKPESTIDSTAVAEPEQNTKSHLGSFILILVSILFIVLVGLYLWSQSLQNESASVVPEQTTERPTPEDNNEPESTRAEAETTSLGIMSTSNEIGAIEADLESTNLDTLDAEMQAIETELDANAE